MRLRWLALVAAATLALAAAAQQADSGGISGRLRLVPRAGVEAHQSSSAYGDRRLRGVTLVDYDTVDFAVVYVEEGPAPEDLVEIAVRETRLGPRFVPSRTAFGARGRILLRNETGVVRVVSQPAAARVVRLEPGGTAELEAPQPGSQQLHLLGSGDRTATIFAAPGPYDVVTRTGRFDIQGLAPGRITLAAWHPRFPKIRRPAEVAPGETLEIDVEMGVGLPQRLPPHLPPHVPPEGAAPDAR